MADRRHVGLAGGQAHPLGGIFLPRQLGGIVPPVLNFPS